ncbi:MAG: CpsD/CapB family tyrosine-protein kinase [Schaedlerella sp.]|nr:CpsD/CapB family tyrosine-protein kinase [Lachnospiraceae bacterium]MDY4201843.1 CpsD/CapB family tyrosine-protein kinase [Schaedlerella sp.]
MEKEKQQKKNWNEQLYNIIRDVLSRWHIICLTGVITAILADLFLTLTYVPMYRTGTSVVLNMGAGYTSDADTDKEVAEALGYVLTSNLFMDKIKEDLNVSNLNGRFSVRDIEGTSILEIYSEADSPQISYRMMYAMMGRYQEVTSLVIGNAKMDVIDKIQVPVKPYNELNHWKNMLAAGAAGAAFMTAVFILMSFMRDTIKEKKDIKEKLQVRLLADVANEPKIMLKGGRLYRKKSLLVTQITTSFAFVETFQRLRARFEAQAQKKKYKIVVINSTTENEGKTSVIVNLAIALARQGRRVLVMDADLGKPSIAKIMDLKPVHTLETVLKGEKEMEEIIFHHERTGLDLIFAGGREDDTTGLLENGILGGWLEENRDNYDYILIDTPPASFMGDSMIVAAEADAVLLVVRQDFAPTVLINRTIERYLQQDTPVMGCVLNRSMPLVGEKKKAYRYRGGEHRGTE